MNANIAGGNGINKWCTLKNSANFAPLYCCRATCMQQCIAASTQIRSNDSTTNNRLRLLQCKLGRYLRVGHKLVSAPLITDSWKVCELHQSEKGGNYVYMYIIYSGCLCFACSHIPEQWYTLIDKNTRRVYLASRMFQRNFPAHCWHFL